MHIAISKVRLTFTLLVSMLLIWLTFTPVWSARYSCVNFLAVLVIVGIVKVSREYGFSIEQYAFYQSEIIWGSIGFWITVGMAVIAFLLLMIDYYMDVDRLQKILMTISLALQGLLFGAICIAALLGAGFVVSVLFLVMLAACLWSAIMLLISEHHRAKFIYLILSSIWVFGGIYILIGIFALIALAIVVGIVIFFTGNGNYKNVYDSTGRFLYRIYED